MAKGIWNRNGKSHPGVGRAHAHRQKLKATASPSTNGSGPTKQEKFQQEIASEPNEDLKTYKSHGVHFHKSIEGEARALCPFCGANAFSVNEGKVDPKKSGMFKCWDCNKTGNKYTFLQLYYDQCFNQTETSHYRSLSRLRDLPVEAFTDAELAYDKTLKRWLIPIRNAKGSMVNLRYWIAETNILYNTGGCKSHLYNLERLSDQAHLVYVCEGEWDCMALEWLLTQLKIKDCSVVAVPGADTFKPEWAEHLGGKKVTLLYDNDDRGREGMEKAANILRKHTKCKELKTLIWPDSYPDKFDIRDYVIKNLKAPKRAYAQLLEMLVDQPLYNKESVGLVRETFEEVVKDFKEHIHLSQDMEDGLALLFATIFSNVILEDPYCPIWTFLVGPSGSGKTLLIQSVSGNHLVNCQDKLTANALVSNYKTPDGSDPSLLPKLIGKTLLVKDWTVIMRMAQGDQETIHAVMRAAFDGKFDSSSGIETNHTYPEPGGEHETCHFTFCAGVTNDIYLENRTSVGERTMKFKIFRGSDHESVIDHLEAAAKNTMDSVVPETILRECANSFIECRSTDKAEIPELPIPIKNRILGLAQISCIAGAHIHRRQGEIILRPSPSVATRITKQLIHLAQSLAFTFRLSKVDERCYEIIKRTALDTSDNYHMDVMMALNSFGSQRVYRDEIIVRASEMGFPLKSTTTFRCLEDLMELGAVQFDISAKMVEDDSRNGPGKKKPGQPARKWYLADWMKELFKLAKIESYPSQEKSPKKKVLSSSGKSGKGGRLGLKRQATNRAPRKKVAKRLKRK